MAFTMPLCKQDRHHDNEYIEDMAAEVENHLLSPEIFIGKYETKHVTLTLPAAGTHWLLTQTEVG
jgi:hypothetical protein